MRACVTDVMDNNNLYTITILHDKRASPATATLPPPQDLSKSEEEADGRAQAPNITSPAGRLADSKKNLFEKNNFDLT